MDLKSTGSVYAGLKQGYFVAMPPETGVEYAYYQGTTPVAYFKQSEIVYSVPANLVDDFISIKFQGANLVKPEPRVALETRISRFIGNDPSKWQSGLQSFAELQFHDIYDGITLVYEVTAEGLKYYFQVQPGMDPSAIILEVQGGESVEILEEGTAMSVSSPNGGKLVDTGLEAWTAQSKTAVDISFILDQETPYTGNPVVRFHIGSYDPSEELIIDPVVL
jgi:hypothetical protein